VAAAYAEWTKRFLTKDTGRYQDVPYYWNNVMAMDTNGTIPLQSLGQWGTLREGQYYLANPMSQFATWPTPQQKLYNAKQTRAENEELFPINPVLNWPAPAKAPKLEKQTNPMYDYFDRLVLNGRGYSVPNEMLTFADTGGGTYPWPTTNTWYEPPAGWHDHGYQWKEAVNIDAAHEGEGYLYDPNGPNDGGGGGGGWGGGDWDYDTHPDLGTISSYYSNYGGGNYRNQPEIGYGAEDTTPWNRYSDQPAIVGYAGNSRRGYGSANYDSHPTMPSEGYRQDPLTYFQQLVKWVI